MNRKVFNVILFTVGAAVGSAVTWKIVTTKYDRLIQEEIESVRAEYANLSQKVKNGEQITDDTDNNDDESSEDEEDDSSDAGVDYEIIHYSNIVKRYQGSEDENDEEGGTGSDYDDVEVDGPYVITPEQFSSSSPGYNAQALDYYADGILADSWGVKLDISETIGEEALEEFGTFVDDVVYVRDDCRQIDYEVTRDPRTYAEAVNLSPNPYHNR